MKRTKSSMEYRADPHTDIWHFCRSCSKWPSRQRANVLWLDKPPRLLELCEECLMLASTGTLITRCWPVSPGVYGLTTESDGNGASEL
jgi:hypothetical protein